MIIFLKKLYKSLVSEFINYMLAAWHDTSISVNTHQSCTINLYKKNNI